MRTNPPLRCRFLLYAASGLVPAPERANWRSARMALLQNWTVLIDRGELTLRSEPDLLRYCWRSFANAASLWLDPAQIQAFFRRPIALPLAFLLFFVSTGLLSGGFAATRLFLNNVATRPQSDSVVPFVVLFSFSLLIGIATILPRRRSLRWHSWRYSTFFASKTVTVLLLVPIVWLELYGWLRAQTPLAEGFFVFSRLISVFAYMAGFACALRWCLIDQSLRCPTCLKLLRLPVSIGSWSSVFDPANTELVCDDGHGSLLIPETDSGASERWTALDPSWQELFETSRSS